MEEVGNIEPEEKAPLRQNTSAGIFRVRVEASRVGVTSLGVVRVVVVRLNIQSTS